ncbi:MAG: A24 family peptidase [Acidimicrobiales bacterium]
MTATVVVAVACAVVGLWVGTGINFLVDRVPQRRPVRPLRTGCRNCLDDPDVPARRPLVPWVARGRRCPACGAAVPVRYPVVEVGTVAAFAAVGLRLGADAALPAYLVFFACLVTISVIDLELRIIPNRIVYPTIALSLPLLAVAALVKGDLGHLESALVGAAVSFGALLLVHLVQPSSMGFGDVRLAFILGLFLGWLSLSHVAVGLFLGFALGAVVGVGLLLFGGRSRKDQVSFGPFLAGGAAVAVLFGQPLVRWWFRQ